MAWGEWEEGEGPARARYQALVTDKHDPSWDAK